MATKKNKSPVELEYDKERRRLQRFVKNAEKRGYTFETNPIPPKPKNISSASVNRLKKLTSDNLYKRAKYVTETGDVISGEKGRSFERSRASSSNKKASTRVQKPVSSTTTQRPKTTAKPKANTNRKSSTNKAPLVEQPTTEPSTDIFAPIEDDFYDEPDNAVPDIPSTNVNDYNPQDLPQDSDIIINNLTDEVGERFGNSFSNVPFNDIALDDTMTQIADWTPSPQWSAGLTQAKEHDRNVLSNILQGAIQSQGREAVARRLEENSDRINNLISEILYGSGSAEGNFKDGRTQVNADLTVFSSIILGRSLNLEESIALTEDGETYEVNN